MNPQKLILSLALASLTFILPQISESQTNESKTVREIRIELRDIFDGPKLNWLYNKANQLKISTQDEVILRELYFKPGDQVTPFILQESERNLRTLRYLRDVHIETQDVDANTVDVLIKAQDTWTIIPQISYSSGSGRTRSVLGMAESDLLGLGKRLEFLSEDDDGRKSITGLYDDNRFMGGDKKLVMVGIDRKDGHKGQLSFGKPLRTLLDKNSFGFNYGFGDTVERLFDAGEERYLFRQATTNAEAYYTIVAGNPENISRRYSFGYGYSDDVFYEATAEDIDDVGLSDEELDLQDLPLPSQRRFSGPFFSFQSIHPEYLSMNYIDRFDRVEDYNLGAQFTSKVQYASEALGSLEDGALYSVNLAKGYSNSYQSFFRGEIGLAGRYIESDLQNTILRTEAKYYNVLGRLRFGGVGLGRHTFASSLLLDYGNDLDGDKEFLIGADTFLRGYKARSFTGDKRLAINIEDRMHLIDDWLKFFSLGAVAFVDVGGATYDSFSDLLGEDLYSDVGAGLRIGFPRSSGSRVVRMDVAFPLRDGPEDEKYSPRFLFSVSQVFDSYLRSEIVQQKATTIETGF